MNESPPSDERLQKILARAGVGSRRRAEQLIAAGRVRVDGEVAQLGQRADARAVQITIDGTPVGAPPPPVTLMLHKPAGVMVTASDERGRRTVFDLIADAPSTLRYVGRLDRDTEGLLLLTTDGELAHRVSHPRYRVDKVYEAEVERAPSAKALALLRGGVELQDGRTAPADIAVIEGDDGRATVRLVIHEGRKRQVRRMLAAAGHPVRRLRRVALGPLKLGDLQAGAARPLEPDEERALRALVGLLDDGESPS